MSEKSIVFVIDDEVDVTKSLCWLIGSVGYHVIAFNNTNSFLSAYQGQPGCLVLDVRMPELSGLELQEILHNKKIMLPIIFISGHGDVPMAVRAMKRGAVDFLTKPVNNQALLDAINSAIRLNNEQRLKLTQQQRIEMLISKLTPREHEVMQFMAQGKSTKHIAEILGISPNTVELHRAKVMKKMLVKTVAELVKLMTGSIDKINNATIYSRSV